MAGTSLAATATGLGFTGLLKELIGEVGDLLEQVIIQMGNCVLWEETVIEKEYPREHNKQKVTCETRVRHYKITLMHVAFVYIALRLAGVLPPLATWPEKLKSTGQPYWTMPIFGVGGWSLLELAHDYFSGEGGDHPGLSSDTMGDINEWFRGRGIHGH